VIARIVREAALLLAVALVPAVPWGFKQVKVRATAPLGKDEVRLADAEQWGPAVIWVDARARTAYETKHIPGALLLNAEEWDALVPKFLDEWAPDKKTVVYGDTSDGADTVAFRLREEMKIENVFVLHDGWDAWARR
jgi:rhodanese-related sulfurtransferase